MQIGELCDALAVEIGSRDIECDNILSEKTLLASFLVHFTLREYFNSYSEHFENLECMIAGVCLLDVSEL